jgi:alpha-L-fucosidase
MTTTPRYLSAHIELWKSNPHAANLAWFKQTKWGLFIHYGLYSQLGAGEWALYGRNIPLAEYEPLADSFRPDRFDAEAITDLALAADMQYINLVSCHHEGFPLWESRVEPWNSHKVCGRDLVQELGEACDRKGLGFFLYFTHILNWRHPMAWPREVLPIGRPEYPAPEPRYKLHGGLGPEGNPGYWQWAHGLLDELCRLSFPVAGIWLDIISGYYLQPRLIPVTETYRRIRARLPHALISFKQGATGEEDFASPELSFHSMGENLRKQGREDAALLADAAWEKNKHKKNEICMTLQRSGWGYVKDTAHYTAEEVRARLAYALKNNCSMLTNVGPLPDGSIHPDDGATLRECGKQICARGWPGPDEAITPE